MPDVPSLEIRLLAQQGNAYPVEMTLADTQQVFRGQVSADLAAWSASGDSRADGQALFDALFASADLMRGWGAAHGKVRQVRVQLRLDAPELHALPWEVLRDDQDLLAADAGSPFSRYLAVSHEWGQAIAGRPIRVLAAISNPTDLEEKYGLPPADVELEARTLEDALNPHPETAAPLSPSGRGAGGEGVSLTFLPSPVTLDRLEAALRVRNGYHILHFVGHGTFNIRAQQAALYLQDQDGKALRVGDDDFAGMLNRLSSPPHLVVLAACQSAKQSMKAAFSGLGPKLVQIGVPAVIAMQENVTVLSARQFAATFYQRLLAHGTVDLAMNEARGTLITNGRFDAAVPVLFMRLPDGRLWDVAALNKSTARSKAMSNDDSKSRSGGVNIGGNVKVGGSVTGRDSHVVNTGGGDIVHGNKTTVDTGGGAYVGGNVNVSGDSKFVGRDDQSQTGLSGEEIARLFASIYQQIEAKTDLKPSEKKYVKADMQDVEAEVAKGDQADEGILERRLSNVLRMAPDILEVISSTLVNPALGAATILRKVIAKVKQEAA